MRLYKSKTDPNNTPWFLFTGIAAGIALFYLGFLSARYNFDGTLFSLWLAQAIQTGHLGEYYHPHHLFYGPASYLFYKCLAAFGIKFSVVVTLQLLDILFAFSTILLFLILCYQKTKDRFVSIVFGLLLAFSFGFWFFSIEPEVYIGYTFSIFVSIFILLSWTKPGPQPAWYIRAILLGILGAFIITNHLTGGLFLLPIGWGCLWYVRDAPGQSLWIRFRKGIPPALLMMLVTFAVIVPVYIRGYEANPLSKTRHFAHWIIGATNPDTGLGYKNNIWNLSPAAFKGAAIGYEEIFLAGIHHRYLSIPGLGVLRILTLSGVLVGLILYLISLPRLMRNDKRAHTLLLLSILPMAAFVVVWDSANFEVKVCLLPLLCLAMAFGFAETYQKAKRIHYRALIRLCVIVVLALLFTHNFFSSIKPGSRPELNKDLQRAYFIRDNTEPGAVIYFTGYAGGYNMGKIYIIFFSGRQTRILDLILGRDNRPFPQPLISSLNADRNRPIYVLPELIQPGTAVDSLGKNHKLKPQQIIEFFKALNLKRIAAMNDGFALYRYDPGPATKPK